MRRPSTYLFDLDGTLIDSVELILQSYVHTLTEHRGESPPAEFFLESLGIPLIAQFRAFTDDEAEVQAMIDTYRSHNLSHHDELVQAFEGVPEMLEEIHRRGARAAIVTSKFAATARRGLEVCGIAEYFEVVIGVDDVVEHKPHPEPVEKALAQLDRPADSAVFIGDSPHDLQAGKSAGARTGAALWGPFRRELLEPHDPDHWLDDPTDILAI